MDKVFKTKQNMINSLQFLGFFIYLGQLRKMVRIFCALQAVGKRKGDLEKVQAEFFMWMEILWNVVCSLQVCWKTISLRHAGV